MWEPQLHVSINVPPTQGTATPKDQDTQAALSGLWWHKEPSGSAKSGFTPVFSTLDSLPPVTNLHAVFILLALYLKPHNFLVAFNPADGYPSYYKISLGKWIQTFLSIQSRYT